MPLRPLSRTLRHLFVDGVLIWLAWQATYLFRLGFDRWLTARASYDLVVSVAIVGLYLGVFLALRVPQHLWRYAGLKDVQRLTLACVLAGAVSAVLVAGVFGLAKVPRAVLALHPVACLMALSLARLLTRSLVEHQAAARHGPAGMQRHVLILGAGEAAKRLVVGIHQRGWQVVGLLDDDAGKWGSQIAGIPILGPLAQVVSHAQHCQATHLILALPSVRGTARRRILDLAAQTQLPLLTVPSAEELRQGSPAERVRSIEPEDLLGREPVQLDMSDLHRWVHDAVVLVTGAGGSIGSELSLQLAQLAPRQLVVVDHAEFALYRIDQQVRSRYPHLQCVPHLLDIKDSAAVERLFETHRPTLVFHAAAYKHVPLVEEGNAYAALCNNTLGTWVVAEAAAQHQVARMVLISTDKAVNPTNVMGATKRAAEIVLTALAERHASTQFLAVRFGNVLGSSGSVIPRFKEQLAQGGPLTVTHPDIIRYFMTIPEACRLVLKAAAIGQSGQVLVLDMGEPVRIVDLARSMIRLSGHREEDISIVYTGLRPGEKLYEELLADGETTLPTQVAQVRRARLQTAPAWSALHAWRLQCEALAVGASDAAALDAEVRRLLKALVPEYQPAPPAGATGAG